MLSRKRTGRGQVTLSRALSKLGAASRSQAEELIAAGKVSINDRPVRDPGFWVDLREDRVAIDGRPVRPRGPVYLMMHKPRGVVTTRSDERGRRTVYDLLPKSLPRVFPLGRLDKDSSGLLLFTNDTRFGERITNPLGMTPKCYSVELDRPLREKDRAAFARGLRLEDGTRCRPARVEHGGAPASYLITITEGKNRQVRRMCASLGYAVRVLERVGIGTVRLGSLPEGGVRSLTPGEVTSLVRAGTP